MENNIDVHIGRRLRRLRWTVGLSQRHLAAQLSATSAAQLNKYENGSLSFRIGELHVISQCLGVPMDYFFEGFDLADQNSLVSRGMYRSAETPVDNRAPSGHAPAVNANAAPLVNQEHAKAAVGTEALITDAVDF